MSTPRIIFLGDSGVGKTSIIYRAKYQKFENNTVPTIGAGTTNMSFKLNNIKIDYQLWDTAGQEIYRNIVPIYFKGSNGAILVFSMNDQESFNSLESWLNILFLHVSKEIYIILVGNKCDYIDTVIDESIASKWAQEHNYPIFFTSAKTGQNIDVLFNYLENKIFTNQFSNFEMNTIKKIENESNCC